MSRKILILSAVFLVAAMAIMVYADPLARLSLGQAGPAFTSNTTRTVTFNNSTFTFNPGSITGFRGRGAVNSSGQIETLAAIALAAVGLVLEFVVVFLWQEEKVAPVQAQPGQVQP